MSELINGNESGTLDGGEDDGEGEGDAQIPDADNDASVTDEEAEVSAILWLNNQMINLVQTDMNGDAAASAPSVESEDEAIVVTRQEEVDPEDEAEFEREYAKMMAESLESRKFERKATFDVPLPLRRKDASTTNEPAGDDSTSNNGAGSGTMAFSLLTKRGNRQQVSHQSLHPLLA